MLTAMQKETFNVAILAGGQGTRLKDRAGRLPKPMMPILGKPLLDHQIELCKRHGFSRILLLVHYEHEMIIQHSGDGSRYGVNLGYHVEETPRGTAGALCDALPRMAETFLVLYGDTYLDVDLRRLWDRHARQTADATLFLHPNEHPQDSDLVEVDDVGSVTAILPYPRPVDEYHRNLVNAALYVLDSHGLHTFVAPHGTSDIAKDLFPAMLSAGKRLFGYVTPEYVKDMGTPDRLDRVELDIQNGLPGKLSGRELRSAVFLDRDGTLNLEVDHLSRPEQLLLHDGAAEAIRRINQAGMLAVVATNQPVVARGDVSRTGLEQIHARLEALLGEGGAYVDRIYVCPHHPDKGFLGEVGELKIECDCRKPKTGLIDAACRDLHIRRASSWLIGDSIADLEAGRQAGLRTVLVRTGHAGRDDRRPAQPDYVVQDLISAAAWILEGHRAMSQRLAPVALAALRARLVLIGGVSRSGKSHAAQVLKELVGNRGRTAHVLSLDSWLRPSTERVEGAGVLSRFDVAKAVNDIGRVVDSTVRTRFSTSIYDRAARAMHPTVVELSVAADDIIIIEGVPALLIEPLRALAQVTVHLEVPETERVARLKADYRWRGYSEQSIDELMALRAKDENVLVNAAGELADYAITSESER
jgi:histidinol-phosphate phosphatase family protein